VWTVHAQQQLLLLVHSGIIVGLATVAGIAAFQESQRQSAINHITQKSIEITSKVQEYAQRPAMRPNIETANSGENEDLVVDFGELKHYETVADGYGSDHVDPYATYSLNEWNSLPDGFNHEDACPDDFVNVVAAYSEEHDVSVCVGITGTSADDLETGVAE